MKTCTVNSISPLLPNHLFILRNLAASLNQSQRSFCIDQSQLGILEVPPHIHTLKISDLLPTSRVNTRTLEKLKRKVVKWTLPQFLQQAPYSFYMICYVVVELNPYPNKFYKLIHSLQFKPALH